MPTTTTPQAQTTGTVNIARINTERLRVPIVGTTPLIVHQFSEKAKRQMLDAMQGRKTPKEAKDPQAEYERAFYRLDDGGYGVPALAFKSATVSAARFYGKSVSMVQLRQWLYFTGEFSKACGMALFRIDGEPVMREDVVTVGISGHDLRYRPQFSEWRTVLDVTYVSSLLTRDSVLSLIDAGGMGVGVGEWRVERKGDSGTYQIDLDRDIEVLS